MENKMPTIEELKASRLNVEVSCFNRCTAVYGHSIRLWHWLLTSPKYLKEQQQIRATDNKRERDNLKRSVLPAITASALLRNRVQGSMDNVIKFTNLLCVDIDLADNTHLPHFDTLIDTLSTISNFIYIGESVSGTGYWGLVPISTPEKLDNHRAAFGLLLKTHYNIILDKSKGFNSNDLRFYSFTANPYFNLQAHTFTLLHEEPKALIRPTMPKFYNSASKDTELLEYLLADIERLEVDITSDYNKWVSIAFELRSSFDPETARGHYHRISQFHPNYDHGLTDIKFDNCIPKIGATPSLGTIINLCKAVGIVYPHNKYTRAASAFAQPFTENK